MKLKQLSIFAVGVVVAAMIAGPSTAFGAVTFTLDDYDIAANTAGPGLEVKTAKVLSADTSFSLNVGSSVTKNLFKIWTDETTVNVGEDTIPKDITVSFSFSEPTPAFSGGEGGQTVGVRGQFSLTDWYGGMRQWGEVNWGAPLSLNYPLGGDGILEISLSKAVFNKGLFGLAPGYNSGATVKATFKLVREASPIPEPLSILVWGGLGVFSILIATVRRRRK